MIVEGNYTFPGTREVLWGMLLDPEVIAKTMPGTRQMTRVSDERYEGKLRVGVGSITAAEFEVSVTLADVVVAERYTLLIDGRGRFGFTRGSAQVQLAPDVAGTGTVMHFKADMQVGGKIAAVGQRLLDSVSKLMTRQGLEALSRELNRRLGLAAAEPQTPPAPPAPRPSVPEAPEMTRLPPEPPAAP